MPMKLMTKELEKNLPKLYETEHIPLEDKVAKIKFFNPCGSGTWYGVEYCPEDRIFFGYVAGLVPGCDEWGYFSLDEFEEVKLPFGLKIERDLCWTPKKMSEIIEE